MSHLSKETILGMPVAEIHKLALSVIRFNYDEKGVVKLSYYDRHNIAWDLVTSIYQKQGTYSPAKGDLAAWMRKVAKNDFSNILRSEIRSVVRNSSIDNPFSNLSNKIEAIEDTFDNLTEEEYNAMETEISLLGETERLLIDLYRNNVKEKDIAQQTGINYNTVRQTIRRTKALLAERVRQRLEYGENDRYSNKNLLYQE